MISRLFILQLPVPGRALALFSIYTRSYSLYPGFSRISQAGETGYQQAGGSEIPSRNNQTTPGFYPRLPRGGARQGGGG